jgi:hypothetical protein
MLKRREECDTYLTYIGRHHRSRKSLVKMEKYKEFSTNSVAFIVFRNRLTKLLAGAGRGKRGIKGGGGRVRL